MTSDRSSSGPSTPGPSPEQRRVAAGQFDRANQVVATGNYDYGIGLLLDCCQRDPANLLYRQALRRAEKAKYRNNLRGSRLAWLWSWLVRARLRSAAAAGRHLQVLALAERLLTRNPWDVGAHAALAGAAEALGLIDLAVWALEQARQKQPADAGLNRALARLYERRGNFTQALALWDVVAGAAPGDAEAAQKRAELASREGGAREVGAADPVGRAAAALRDRLKDDPTSAALHLELGGLYRRAGRLEEAHAALAEGLFPTGNAFALAAELADLEIEPFRRDLAVAEEKLAASPDDVGLRRIRLQLHREVNTRELDLHRRRADRFPGELAHRYELGVRLLRAGQLDEAARELQASRADPRFRWRASLSLAGGYKTRNNLRLAQRHFEDALEALPEGEAGARKDVLYELACLHADAGQLAQALDRANQLALLDNDYRDVRARLEEWQARLRQAHAS
jgi:predicted Zn-dependent protease